MNVEYFWKTENDDIKILHMCVESKFEIEMTIQVREFFRISAVHDLKVP
jgi:hypothetical protein